MECVLHLTLLSVYMTCLYDDYITHDHCGRVICIAILAVLAKEDEIMPPTMGEGTRSSKIYS